MQTNNIDPTADWGKARNIVQTWLAEHAAKPGALAREAGLNRSILSRFLAGKALDAGSAMKLFSVVQRTMDSSLRVELLEAMGLLSLALTIRDSLLDTPAADIPTLFSPGLMQVDGRRVLSQACDAIHRSWTDAAALFRQAEKVFNYRGSDAAEAALSVAQMLRNQGDFDGAERELARIRARYANVLDAALETRIVSLTADIYFARRDLVTAEQWFLKSKRLCELAGLPHHVAAQVQILGVIYTAEGKRAATQIEADHWFALAEQNLNQSLAFHAAYSDEGSQGYDLFRLAQLYACAGRCGEALEALRKARTLFATSEVLADINVAYAGWLLEDGETWRARALAEAALDVQARRGYAQGMARAARALSLAAYQDSKPLVALLNGVAAVLFNPYITFEDQMGWRAFVAELSGAHLRQAGYKEHRVLMDRTRDQVRLRQGVFRYLGHIVTLTDEKIDRLLSELSDCSDIPDR